MQFIGQRGLGCEGRFPRVQTAGETSTLLNDLYKTADLFVVVYGAVFMGAGGGVRRKVAIGTDLRGNHSSAE